MVLGSPDNGVPVLRTDEARRRRLVMPLFISVLVALLALGLWSAVYLGAHYFERFRQAEVDRWRLAAKARPHRWQYHCCRQCLSCPPPSSPGPPRASACRRCWFQ